MPGLKSLRFHNNVLVGTLKPRTNFNENGINTLHCLLFSSWLFISLTALMIGLIWSSDNIERSDMRTMQKDDNGNISKLGVVAR